MSSNYFKSVEDAIFTASLLVTREPMVQTAHIDFPKMKRKETKLGYILDMPLCHEGSYLFLWSEDGLRNEMLKIPFGTFLLRRSDVFHGGYGGRTGNLRLHLEFTNVESDSTLYYPRDVTMNQYEMNALQHDEEQKLICAQAENNWQSIFNYNEKNSINILDIDISLKQIFDWSYEKLLKEEYMNNESILIHRLKNVSINTKQTSDDVLLNNDNSSTTSTKNN